MKVETVASTQVLSRADLLAGPVETFEKFKKDSGITGFQFVPIRNIHPHLGRSLAQRGLVVSLHQSWLNLRALSNWPYAAVLPTPKQSLRVLREVEAASGRALPVVVHPKEQLLGKHPQLRGMDYAKDTALHGLRLHQPTREVLQAWGVLDESSAERTTIGMLEAQRERGFGGIAIDLYHLMAERGGGRLSASWCNEFVGSLAARGACGGDNEVQLAFRPDFAPTRAAADQERAALTSAMQGVEGLRNTPQGFLLDTIHDAAPFPQDSIRVTLEIPGTVLDYYPRVNSAIIAKIGSGVQEVFA